jgi:uncharacterized protein YndB with AHSA1/START domain
MNTSDSTTNMVVLERTFDAPIGEVWQMWTEPAEFASWYGPSGASVPVCEMEVGVGGRRRVCMQFDTPSGPREMWFTGEYVEVNEPVRLVYTEAITDAEGTLLPDGHPPTEVSVEFTEAGEQTHMVLTHRGIPAGSPGEAGWRAALDEFDRRLTQR